MSGASVAEFAVNRPRFPDSFPSWGLRGRLA